MPIPAHLFLKDDGGTPIKGSSDVQNREGSIEVLSFSHGLHIPVDGNTGKQTGTRVHGAFTIGKEFDSASTYLYKAVSTGAASEISGNEMVPYKRCRSGRGILQYVFGKRQSRFGYTGNGEL